jgi:hypothetical protein
MANECRAEFILSVKSKILRVAQNNSEGTLLVFIDFFNNLLDLDNTMWRGREHENVANASCHL